MSGGREDVYLTYPVRTGVEPITYYPLTIIY